MRCLRFVILTALLLGITSSRAAIIEVAPADARMMLPLIAATPPAAGGGGGNCANAEYEPSADISNAGWAFSTGTTMYVLIDEGRASHICGDYIHQRDDNHDAGVVTAPMPGDCDVDSVNLYVYGYQSGGSGTTTAFEVSANGSDWSSAQNWSPSGTAEVQLSFTSLGYTTPAVIYIRFTPTTTTYQTINFCTLTVETSPP